MPFADKPPLTLLSAEQCRDNARLCRDMAAYPGNSGYSSFLLEIAKSWDELASALAASRD